ncbi:Delta(1)-pyrroline-2-carboxylate reductase [compost metagenome]
MIELLAGALIGDLTSAESLTFDAGAGATPCHGELLLAFDPQRFGADDFEQGQQRAEQLFHAITGQGARLPSQRRFTARQRSQAEGVWVERSLLRDIEGLLT